jgi:hypothetical protein
VKDFTFHYFDRKWLVVYGYLLIILSATPHLPLLIRWASSRWQAGSISGFVLGVEIFLGALLLFLAGGVFFFNRRRFSSFIFIIGGLLTSAIIFYLIIPNPYELTHLPEYAVLSILILQALKEKKGKEKEKLNDTYIYPVRRFSSSGQRWYKRESWVWNRFKILFKTSNRVYFRSAAITGALGVIDELYQGVLPLRYFTWYDIFLNMLGGLFGLTILWGIIKE